MTLKGRALPAKTLLAGLFCLVSACSNGSDLGRTVADQRVDSIAATLSQNTSPAEAAALIADVAAGNPLSPAEVETWDNAITPIADTLFNDKPITPWANVPTSGTAAYVGGLELVPDQNNADRVFGTLRASADFENEIIAGVGDNFVHIDSGTAQPGQLLLTGAFFRGNDLTSDFGISGALTGELTGDVISGDVDVEVSGDFADSGTVIYGGGTGTAGSTDVRAAFVLSQD